jgi:imidazolonepropionase-like amidohydrolase
MRDLNRKIGRRLQRTKQLSALLLFSFFWHFTARPVASFNPDRILAITHVTIVDVTGGSLKTDSDVLISGDRIIAIGAAGTIALPDNCVIIDAARLYLIPGLWDMHVHTLREDRIRYFPVFVANGVLGIRDMGSPLSELGSIRAWRRDAANGTLLGPRIVAAGPLLDGPRPMFPEISLAVGNEEEARRAVDCLALEGADFFKVYSLLPRDAYYGIADESKHLGIPFAGHVPDSMSASEAAEAGQKSIEHLTGIWPAVSGATPEPGRATASAETEIALRQSNLVTTLASDEYDPSAAEAVFSRFVRNNTWQVPTLSTLSFFSRGDTWFDSKLPAHVDPCSPVILAASRRPTAQPVRSSRFQLSGFDKALFLVAAMHRAGVKFMAGTDAPNPFTPAGRSLHQELALLVGAGFTNLEALQTATINPAEYLGMLDQMGTVDEGKLADLVLLGANPLEEIHNTGDIEAVIIRGRLIQKSKLKEMAAPVDAVE